MADDPLISDITKAAEPYLGKAKALQAKLETLNTLGICVSDTETTGLSTGSGLTEFASIRPKGGKGNFKLEMFHSHVLPLRPQFQDYLAKVKKYKEKDLPAYEREYAAAKAADRPAPKKPSPPVYDRELYEYDIAPQALEVTGTELIRKSLIDSPKQDLDGPIVGIRVLGKDYYFDGLDLPSEGKAAKGKRKPPSGKAYPFYEIWPKIEEFTSKKQGSKIEDVYYNTPYDKPFLHELILDNEAYQIARQLPKIIDEARFKPARDYITKVAPDLLDLDYEEASDQQRATLVDAIREGLHPHERYANSAQYQCLLYGTMAARGINESNTLDRAYEWVLGEPFAGRQEHSAVQDICMAAAVAGKVSSHFGNADKPTIPTMLGLFERLVHRVDPGARIIEVRPPRHKVVSERSKKPDEIVLGDIEIVFSKPLDVLEKTNPKAATLWEFINEFDVATKRNDRLPKHVLECDSKGGEIGGVKDVPRVIINAERSKPLSLNFLKKWMLFDQIARASEEPVPNPVKGSDYSGLKIVGFVPHDSTGTRVDVWTQHTDPSGKIIPNSARKLVTDCHYGSLRANLDFFTQHPALVEQGLMLISRLRAQDPRIGIVLIREHTATNGELLGYDLKIKGHSRQFGDVTIQLPKDKSLLSDEKELSQKVDQLLKIGIIPFADSLHNAKEQAEDDVSYEQVIDSGQEDQDESRRKDTSKPIFQSTVNLGAKDDSGKQISVVLDKPIMQLMCMQLHQTLDDTKPEFTMTTQQGRNIHVRYEKDREHYILSGDMDGFWDFVYPNDASDAIKELAEKPANVMRNASWLLHRLKHIPGTYGVEIHGDSMVHLKQKDGVSVEALNILYQAGVQFKVYKDEIKIDARQLMHDAFHWSLRISRLQQDREKDRKKPIDKQTKAPSASLRSAHHALLRGNMLAMEVDELGQCWALDGSRVQESDASRKDDREVHYQVYNNLKDIQDYVLTEDGRIDPYYSPIKGDQHLSLNHHTDGSIDLSMSPLAYTLWQTWRKKHGLGVVESRVVGERVYVDVSANHSNAMVRQVEGIVRGIYAIEKLTDVERLPLVKISMGSEEPSNPLRRKLTLTLPKVSLFNDTTLLPELLGLYQHISDSRLPHTIHHTIQTLPRPHNVDRREGDLLRLCEDTVDAFGAVELTADKLTALQFEMGGGPFSSRINALQFPKRIHNDLGQLGLFIHEISSEIKRAEKGGGDQTQKLRELRQLLNDVNAVREKLFRFSTASERLDEAGSVLRNVLVGSDSRRGTSLKTALTNSILHVVDAFAIKYGQFDSERAFASSMEGYERLVDRFLGISPDGDGKTRADEIKMKAYVESAYRILPLLHDPGQKVDDLSMIARYLLVKAHPKWGQANASGAILVDEMLAIFKHGVDAEHPDSRPLTAQHIAAFRQRWAAMLPKNDKLLDQFIDQRLKIDGLEKSLEAKLKHIPDEVRSGIDKTVYLAYKERVKHYMRLIGDDHAQEHGHQAEYIEAAKKCLRRQEELRPDKRKSDDEIERYIEKRIKEARKRTVSEDSYLHSLAVITQEVKDLDARQLKSTIDLEGREAKFRTAEEKQWRDRETKKHIEAQADFGKPFAEFRTRKALLTQIEKALMEAEDMQLVIYHGTKDLAAAIAQLHQSLALGERLLPESKDSIASIKQTITDTPRAFGMNDSVLERVASYRDRLVDHITGKVKKALLLDDQSIGQDNHMTCRIDDLVTFIDRREKDLAADLDDVVDSDRVVRGEGPRASLAIHYASHLNRCVKHFDIIYHHKSLSQPQGKVDDLDSPRQEENYFTYIKPDDPTPQDTMLQNLFKQLESARMVFPAGTASDGSLRLDVRPPQLARVTTLITLMDQLSHVSAIKDITLNTKDLTLHCTADIPPSWKEREKIKGELDLALLGLPAERPSWPTILGEQGEQHSSHFVIELSPDVLKGNVPEIKALDIETTVKIVRAAMRAQGKPVDEQRAVIKGLEAQGPHTIVDQGTISLMQMVTGRLNVTRP